MHQMQHHEQLIFIRTMFCINKQFIIINIIDESSFFLFIIKFNLFNKNLKYLILIILI